MATVPDAVDIPTGSATGAAPGPPAVAVPSDPTPCVPLTPLTCAPDAVDAAGGTAALTPLANPFAEAMRGGAAWVMETTLGWWVDVPAVDLASSPAVTIRGWVLWLSLAVATAGMMWQGVQLVLSRRPDPLLGIGRGLFTLALWAGIGIAAPAAAMRAGDAFATWVLDEASSGDAARRLMVLGNLTGVDANGAVIVLGLLLIFAGLAQAVLMIFREGAVVILAGVVVLAASGSMTAATRPWLPRVLAWMAALIAYKPIAALVYATALAMIGEGTDPRTVLVGLTMMLLAIVALPALMRFFTWTTGDLATGTGGSGAAAFGMAASGLHAAATLSGSRGARGSAGAQVASVRQDLGPAVTAPPTTGPTPSAPPSGAGASAASLVSAAGTVAAGAATAGPPGAAVAGGAVLAQGTATSAQRGASTTRRHTGAGGES